MINIKAFDSVCIWSETPDKLAEFYENTLELKVESKIDLPDDKGTIFNLNGVLLFIGYHNKVHGKAKDPFRIMPDFLVDSVDKVYEELEPRGVNFIRKPSWSPDKMYKISTISDPEGNILQFVSDIKAEE